MVRIILLWFAVATSAPSLLCGDGAEHRRIGDAAFVTALESDSAMRKMFADVDISGIVCIARDSSGNDVVVTYGMIGALLAKSNADPVQLLASLQRSMFSWNGGPVVLESWLHYELRSIMDIPPPQLHQESMAHRSVPAMEYEKQLHNIDELLARTFLPTVRDRDEYTRTLSSHTDTLRWDLPSTMPYNLTAPSVFSLLHARARALALYGLASRKAQERKRFVLLAVFTNAVADHYLQDLFASEHHIADCSPPASSMLHDTAQPPSMEERACHDFYRKVGIPMPFAHQPTSQILYGSGNFDEDQIARAVLATTVSVSDVFTAPVAYYDFVDAYIEVVNRRSVIADSYGHPLTHAPMPLLPATYEDVRPLHRSIVGPFVQAGATALTQGRSVGFSIDATAGIVLDLSPENMPRSRSAGYETELAFVPTVVATYGFTRDAWFAMARLGASVQIVDNVRAGLSSGPSFAAAGVTLPVFLDFAFISKPLSYHLGMEFNLSVSLTQSSPYDVRVGVAYALY